MKVRSSRLVALSDGSQTVYFGGEYDDDMPQYSYSAALSLNIGPNGRLRMIKTQRGRVIYSRMNGKTHVRLESRKVRQAKDLALRAIAAYALGLKPTFEIDL